MSRFFSGSRSSRSSSSESSESRYGNSAHSGSRSGLSGIGPARLSDIDRANNNNASSQGVGSMNSLFESGSNAGSRSTSSRSNRAGRPATPANTGSSTTQPSNYRLIPAGGGREDPRMERESLASSDRAGSYPPRSCASSTAVRNQSGYQKLTWGAYPPNYRPSTAPNRGDSGYDHERYVNFPKGTPMHTEYASYKKVAGESSEANTKVKTAEKSFSNYNKQNGIQGDFGGYTREQHDTLAKLAKDAGDFSKANSEARNAFNEKHIGRMSRDSMKGHRQQSEEAAAASEGYYKLAFDHKSSGLDRLSKNAKGKGRK